jgi:hypothetical protein
LAPGFLTARFLLVKVKDRITSQLAQRRVGAPVLTAVAVPVSPTFMVRL